MSALLSTCSIENTIWIKVFSLQYLQYFLRPIRKCYFSTYANMTNYCNRWFKTKTKPNLSLYSPYSSEAYNEFAVLICASQCRGENEPRCWTRTWPEPENVNLKPNSILGRINRFAKARKLQLLVKNLRAIQIKSIFYTFVRKKCNIIKL